jgi:hypothetical protein
MTSDPKAGHLNLSRLPTPSAEMRRMMDPSCPTYTRSLYGSLFDMKARKLEESSVNITPMYLRGKMSAGGLLK